MGRDAFVAKVWEWKAQSGGTILEQSRRLGNSFDLSRNAFTMSGAPGAPAGEEGNFHDAVLKVFVDFYERGLIFRGKRLVNWDPHFETAISDLEVEQVEAKGHLWRLRYPLEDGATYQHPTAFDDDGRPTAFETRDYLVVATTRPETMLGDTGVAVHPDDPRYAHLVGKTVRLPLVGRSIPIVADAYADPEKGTGAVKITPAHDFNDWEVGQRAGLAAINVMDTRARIALKDNAAFGEDAHPADELADLDGLDRYEARELIVTLAQDQGWLDGIDEEVHTVPHGDRSKVAIEPFLTDQWYVDAAKLAGPALDAVRDGRTRILPESQEKTYYHWLENIEPWCISRQLWWGHQIPVWYGDYVDANGQVLHGPAPDPGERGVFQEHGRWFRAFCGVGEDAVREDAEAWYRSRIGRRVIVRFEGEPDDEAHDFAEEPGTIFVTLRRDPDVLDTWFSSGIWPLGTLGWPEDTPELERYYPTSVLVTGFDILFFWVARMMMMQLALVGEVPFRDVYIHPLVRDEKGKKMSKSLGNILDPLELIDEFGADAVRFTLTAMAAMGRDIKLSRDRIAGYRNFGTKLWNAARFAEMNDCRPDPSFDPTAVTLTANRWIVGETGRLRETLDAALAGYRFNDAAAALYAHVWGKVCDWYVELAKPLLDGEGAAETRATMAWVLDQCLILMHPVMPFITESLWGQIAERPQAALPRRLAGLRLRADRPGRRRRDELGDRAHRGDPLGPRPDARPRRRPRHAGDPRDQPRAGGGARREPRPRRPARPRRALRDRRRGAEGRGHADRAGRELRPAARRGHRHRRRARPARQGDRQARPRGRRPARQARQPGLRRPRPRGRGRRAAHPPRSRRGGDRHPARRPRPASPGSEADRYGSADRRRSGGAGSSLSAPAASSSRLGIASPARALSAASPPSEGRARPPRRGSRRPAGSRSPLRPPSAGPDRRGGSPRPRRPVSTPGALSAAWPRSIAFRI